jgi:hypothetical protein
MKIKLDTQEGEGLHTHLKPYEATALNEIWNAQEPIGSGKVWRILDDKGIKTAPDARNTVSRASVILFLNSMVDDGVLNWKDGTGKGGHHRLYFPKVSREEYPKYVVEQVVEGLMRTFPEDPLVLKIAALIGM